MIKIKIDNKVIVANEGMSIITIADRFKIPIPRFCYHQELSVVGNCGMCMVEVSNIPKLLPACSTLVAEGMQIFTNTPKVISSQQAVMELLLANHPLDCPICEKSGECELQNISLQFGKDYSNFQEYKRTGINLDLGPLITTNMDRCIHCTRCVRFSEEIAGNKELGIIFKGSSMKVTNYYGAPITSEISGNMIDLCPVGALVSKPCISRGAGSNLQQKPGISMHDCIGSNINYQVNVYGEIQSAIPRNNIYINNIWLSDRDRFSVFGINSKDRLKYPLIKKDNKWYIATWPEAFEFINHKLSKIIQEYGPNQLGGLITPNATLEEGFIFQYLLRSLGSNNIDHRLRQIDFREKFGSLCYPYLTLKNISELKRQQVVVLLGSYINKEQPIAAMYIRAAIKNNCKIIVINPIDFELGFTTEFKFIPNKADLLKELLQLIKAIAEINTQLFPEEINNLTKDLKVSQKVKLAAEILLAAESKKVTIILGDLAVTYPDYTNLVAISKLLARAIDANFGCLVAGANSLGLYLMDCLPDQNLSQVNNRSNLNHNFSLDAEQMLQSTLKAYMLYGIEPELDCAYGVYAASNLAQANFILSFTAFESDLLLKYSDVLLPIALPPESGGSYLNVTAKLQSFPAIAKMPGESQAGTRIFMKLAKDFGIDLSCLDLQSIIHEKLENFKNDYYQQQYSLQSIKLDLEKQYNLKYSLIKISPVAIYSSDPIVRRAICLQETLDAQIQVLINPLDAKNLNLFNNEKILIKLVNHNYSASNFKNLTQTLPVRVSDQVPYGCIFINQVNLRTLLGLSYQNLIIEKAKLEV